MLPVRWPSHTRSAAEGEVDGLGRAQDEAASLAIVPLTEHPDASVRLAVAQALPGGVESSTGTAVVADALVRLSSDDADEVREWATFGLGTILSLAAREVRSALPARLDDTSAMVRDESTFSLAACSRAKQTDVEGTVASSEPEDDQFAAALL